MTSSNFPSLASLLERNAAWASRTSKEDAPLLESCARGQAPKVLWIGCADSRVPETTVLGAKPGEVFVHRNIANQVMLDDDNVTSVLTYAVEALGVEHIVVVGHTSCGGVNAGIEGKAASSTSSLGRWLTPLTNLAKRVASDSGKTGNDLAAAVTEANVRLQVDNLVQNEIVQANWKGEGASQFPHKVWVHGWVYDVATGKLTDVGATRGPQ